MVESKRAGVVPVEHITQSIRVFRGQKVLLDSELATLYGVTTGRLNEAVKRNLERFPGDFMFQLTAAEHAALISQIATSKTGRGGRRKLPWVFTEHGAIQAANVLNSPRAVEMGIYVVRAFVKLRELLASNRELARRFDELEARLDKKLTAHDEAIAAILSAIRQLMNPPAPKRGGIGFTADLGQQSELSRTEHPEIS
ncbi:MAG TPA: ORF6N domain-containing protein [Steroidobacteraceae bacterium]|nr:ORF6N domain-containing protein [Steroidobacteraceae bacterium]